MKSKIIFSVFTLIIFLLGFFGGFYAGIVGGAGSYSSQLYAGAQEMSGALNYLASYGSVKGNLQGAKTVLCRSINTRLNILDAAEPMLNPRKVDEISAIKQQWLFNNVNRSKENMDKLCAH